MKTTIIKKAIREEIQIYYEILVDEESPASYVAWTICFSWVFFQLSLLFLQSDWFNLSDGIQIPFTQLYLNGMAVLCLYWGMALGPIVFRIFFLHRRFCPIDTLISSLLPICALEILYLSQKRHILLCFLLCMNLCYIAYLLEMLITLIKGRDSIRRKNILRNQVKNELYSFFTATILIVSIAVFAFSYFAERFFQIQVAADTEALSENGDEWDKNKEKFQVFNTYDDMSNEEKIEALQLIANFETEYLGIENVTVNMESIWDRVLLFLTYDFLLCTLVVILVSDVF